MLVDHADAEGKRVAGGLYGRECAVHVDLAAVGVIDPGDHVHEGGFAAAVFAEHGQNLAAPDGHGHIAIGDHGSKGFGDVADLNRRCCGIYAFFFHICDTFPDRGVGRAASAGAYVVFFLFLSFFIR